MEKGKNEERENSTIEKYLQNIQSFANWLQEREVTKENEDLNNHRDYIIIKHSLKFTNLFDKYLSDTYYI